MLLQRRNHWVVKGILASWIQSEQTVKDIVWFHVATKIKSLTCEDHSRFLCAVGFPATSSKVSKPLRTSSDSRFAPKGYLNRTLRIPCYLQLKLNLDGFFLGRTLRIPCYLQLKMSFDFWLACWMHLCYHILMIRGGEGGSINNARSRL